MAGFRPAFAGRIGHGGLFGWAYETRIDEGRAAQDSARPVFKGGASRWE
jgi:hypothetical protein